MPKRHISGLLITFCLCLVLLLAGCAAKKGFGPTQFKPGNLKKKIAVIPFENNTDFGRAELGRRIADSIAQQLAQSGKVIIVPHTKVETYITAQQIPRPLTQGTAALLGRSLKLNAVVLGAVSAIHLTDKKIGWRLYIPVFKKKEVVTANLLVKVIDVEGGTFLLTGTSLGNTAHELESAREWPTGSQGDLDQALVDRSLTLAIQSLTKSILETLTNAPWKGFVRSISGSTAILSAGRDVGIKPGHRFVVLGVGEKITNTAGRTYIIPGPVKAILEITRVLAETSEARITSGHVLAGEAVYFAS